MDEYEIANRAYALADRFGSRLEPRDLATVREFADVGEWGEELDLLLACLHQAQQPVTAAERNELLELLNAMGMPTAPVTKLNVQD